MNLAFLLPAGLAALAALLLPLLVHLARRSESRPTVFAALRWLQARPRPRHRIRFDEKRLLAMRLLLLVLCALLLAHPVLSGADDARPVVAVSPVLRPGGIDAVELPPDARRVWLAEGFPTVGGAPAPRSNASPTSLLRELDAALPRDVALTVLVPSTLDGVDAERPRLSRRVHWRVLPAAMATAPTERPRPLPRLAIRHAGDAAPAVRVLQAVDAAWRPELDVAPVDIGPLHRPLPSPAHPVAWLAPGPVPQAVRGWVARGGTLLLDTRAAWTSPRAVVLWRDADAAPLVEGFAHGRGRVLRFVRALAPREMPVVLEATFPTDLRLLLATESPPPSRVAAGAHAPLRGGPVFLPAPRDLQPWLLLAIALLFAIERWMATGPRRGDAP